ncbi:MAG TPA: alpha-amylase family glycosyl hydrolase [Anaerolineales bacterium]|nr:alpha-amylase family glycosyl hydrolase [Anaerolineales bacterium]
MLHHDGSPLFVQAPQPTALHFGDEVTIRVRALKNAPIERLLLRICPDGEQFFSEMQCEPTLENAPCQWWQAKLTIHMPVTAYRFLIFARDGVWWYNQSGLHAHTPTDAEDFKLLAEYDAPDWVRSSVFYQIFPDRFADGDPTHNVQTGEYEYHGVQALARRWGEAQSEGLQSMVEFYGGDLQGIGDKLDYLSELGINALYLNPIFSAYSNHRYDVVDYHQVDEHLGGNAALIVLRQALSQRAMRVILDIVPNHCGYLHPWFQSAQVQPDDPFSEFFSFRQHPHDYESWLGVRSLPKLNYRSQALRQTMYASASAIFRIWLQPPFSADGWRVDVANMLARHGKDQLEQEVWQGIRQAVKESNPQAYFLGENFFDGSSQLQGDNLDANMNYAGFTHPLMWWLNGFNVGQHAEPRHVESTVPWRTQALVDTWQAVRAAVPWQIACQQFNLLGSHDTPRFSHWVGNHPELIRLAVTFLMTYVGVPCIYYGDEIGMKGASTHAARNCMEWDTRQWDLELLEFYKKLIALRRTSPALTAGGFQVVLVEENTLGYIRTHEQEILLVIGNRSEQVRPAGALPLALAGLADGMVFAPLFGGEPATVQNSALPLPAQPCGVQVWHWRKAGIAA